MKYFVSIENTFYLRWQIELLYESFRMHNMEDDLIIACAEEDNVKLPYKNVFYHQNIGRDLDYRQLNRPYSVLTALDRGIIKQPFNLIEPDMVLHKPMKVYDSPIVANDIWYMGYDVLQNDDGYRIKNWFGIDKEDWINGGIVFQFNDAPDVLFERIFNTVLKFARTFRLESKKLSKKLSSYWCRDMVAYIVALVKGGVPVELVADFEAPMWHQLKPNNEDVSFIHYNNGVPDFFEKRMYARDEHMSAEILPFSRILSIKHNGKKTKYFQKVTKRYLDNNPNIGFILGYD